MTDGAEYWKTKQVVVSGGSKGIGAEIVNAFLQLGSYVTVISRSRPKLIPETLLPRMRHIQCDLAVKADRVQIEAVLSKEPVDVLINNAGVYESSALLNPSFSSSVMELNYEAVVALSRQLQDQLVRRSGAIVNISSVNGRISLPNGGPYCVSKAALDMATRCLARELGPLGVRVNAVAPGPVKTDLLADAMGSQPAETLIPHLPLGRLGDPRDIANAVVWLASPKASWITGQCLPVDGGMTC